MDFYSVILAGGNGTRLWPVSRATKPKQFLAFDGEGTLFQKALIRNQLIPTQKTLILTGSEHAEVIDKQLMDLGIKNTQIIIEPTSKNTAPAITAAVLSIYNESPEAIIIVVPSDHDITPIEVYKKNIDTAKKMASKGYFVTLGVKPTRPETAFGYIKQGNELIDNIFNVENFIEKPNFDTAIHYFNSGNYYWNSGIFVFAAKTYLKAFEKFEPNMMSLVKQSLANALVAKNKVFLNQKTYKDITQNSIDYALMEKVDKIIVIKANFFWNDMGTWKNVWESQKKDGNGNVLSENALGFNIKNSFINSSSGKLIAAVDLEDISIIDTEDAILVTNNRSSHNVKHIVQELNKQKRPEALQEKVVFKPWGSFETIRANDKFLIKKIIVKPSGKLSLQLHQYRSEHWVIVKGIAEVTIGEEVSIVKENEHVYIPQSAKHRLVNLGKENLEMIEIQIGDLLLETDIKRLDDIYGRG